MVAEEILYSGRRPEIMMKTSAVEACGNAVNAPREVYSYKKVRTCEILAEW